MFETEHRGYSFIHLNEMTQKHVSVKSERDAARQRRRKRLLRHQGMMISTRWAMSYLEVAIIIRKTILLTHQCQ